MWPLTKKPSQWLNAEKRAILAQAERESFDRHCRAFDLSPDEFKRQNLESIQAYATKWSAQLGAKLTTRALMQTDGLAAAKAGDQLVANSSIYLLKKHVKLHELDEWGIDRGFLQGLAHAVDARDPTTSRRKFTSFLSSIPRVFLYDARFSAFATTALNQALSGIPVIGVYRQLNGGIEHFVDMVLPAIAMCDESGISAVAPDQIPILAADKRIGFNIDAALRVIFGAGGQFQAVDKYLFSTLYPDARPLVVLVQSMASKFIEMHEYGHVLRGHIAAGATQRAEYEADAFATRIIFRECAELPEGYKSVGLLAVSMLFAILILIEAESGTVTSSSHPTAMDRFGKLFDLFHYGEELECQAAESLNRILLACKPAMEKRNIIVPEYLPY